MSASRGNQRESFRRGLQLSRSTKGIQNTRRSVRHLGANSSHHEGSSSHHERSSSYHERSSSGGGKSLESNLAKIGRRSTRRNLNSSTAAAPTNDDLSIDDSVNSDAQQRKQKQHLQQQQQKAPRSGRPRSNSGEVKEDSSGSSSSNNNRGKQITRRDSFRLPPRRNTTATSARRAAHDPLSSKSDHIRSSSSSHARATHSINSDNTISNNNNNNNNNTMDLSRSEHGTATSSSAASGAVKGIYNLIGSMDASATPTKSETNPLQPHERRAIRRSRDTGDTNPAVRRTRSTEGNITNDAAAHGGSSSCYSGSKSLHGIRNLLDGSMKDASTIDRSLKDGSMIDGSLKDRSLKDGSIKDKSMDDDSGLRGVAVATDKKEPPKDAAGGGEELGVIHSRSIQGIYNLLGNMRDVKKGSVAEEQQPKEKSHTPRPPARAPRLFQGGNKASLGRFNNRMPNNKQQNDTGYSSSSNDEEEVPPAKKMTDAIYAGAQLRRDRMRLERMDSRRRMSLSTSIGSKVEDAAPPELAPPAQPKGDKINKDTTKSNQFDDEDVGCVATTRNVSEDDDDLQDFDTVATPKTVAEPQSTAKEAPPPPQRKIVARRNRNTLPRLAPQNTTGSRQSAPAKIPSTPTKSPGGFVIEMGPEGVATPVTGKPQISNNMMTPVATMPVMPRNDSDSVATPKTVPGTPAPKDLAPAPPPPPKRSLDPAQRWKERAKNRFPVLPGPATPSMNRPSTGARAPSMSMLSPGGIVIEVNPATHSHLVKQKEPMTPSMAGELTPGSYRKSPYYKSMRNAPTRNSRHGRIPNTASMHSTSGFISELSDGSYPSVPSTPSAHSTSGDISELTPGTFVGRMTPRQTPRTTGHAPGTPNYYNSPAGFISELTPGGYSVGLLGDEEDDQGLHLRTPSASFHSNSPAGVISELTPTTYGILLEESSQEESLPRLAQSQAPLPSTPSLHSPAGVVSELTPGTNGISRLDERSGQGGPTINSIPVGPLSIPETPSSTSSVVSELTPGTYGVGKAPVPTTPSLHSPAGIVSDASPGNASNISFHSDGQGLQSVSGIVSELTPGTYAREGLLKDGQSSGSSQVPILG